MEKENCIKVSIIIPIYNTEKYLPQCLDSVTKQSFRDMEIICIDDGSTDNSYEIAKSYAEKDKRFVLLQNDENLGLSATRNRGIKVSVGKYIQFLDSDDYLKDNAICHLYELANRNETDVIFFGAVVVADEDGRELRIMGYKETQKFYSGVSFFKAINEKDEYQSASCFQFWKRTFLINNALFFQDGIVYEDTLFTLKAILAADRIMTISEILYVYRKRLDSISHCLGIKQLPSCIMVYSEILKIWIKSPNPDEIAFGIQNRLNVFERRIRYILGSIEERPQLYFSDKIQLYIYEQFCKMPSLKSLYIKNFDKEVINKLKEYEKLYVYGAGIIAKDMLTILKENEIKVTGIIVTKKNKEANEILGYPVMEVAQMEHGRKDIIVVLALARIWHLDIIKKLNDLHLEYIDIMF